MANKKDFSQVNTGRVFEEIAEATAPQIDPAKDPLEIHAARRDRKTYTDAEALAIMDTLQTTGRKGVKLPRINVAFTPEVYMYITTMAQVRGQTITQFVNHILRKSMEDNREIYEKAIEFRNSL